MNVHIHYSLTYSYCRCGSECCINSLLLYKLFSFLLLMATATGMIYWCLVLTGCISLVVSGEFILM